METTPSEQLQRRVDLRPALGAVTLVLLGAATFGVGSIAASPHPVSAVHPAATVTTAPAEIARVDPTPAPTPAASVPVDAQNPQQADADQAAADAAAKKAADAAAARAAAKAAAQRAAAQQASGQQTAGQVAPQPAVVAPPAPVVSDLPSPDPSSSPSDPAGCAQPPADPSAPGPCPTPSS